MSVQSQISSGNTDILQLIKTVHKTLCIRLQNSTVGINWQVLCEYRELAVNLTELTGALTTL